jgi:hypothetical protein
MTATGVVVVTPQSARRWVGHRPASRLVVRELREVRSIARIVVCNFTGGPLSEPDAEVIDMPQWWPGAPPMSALHGSVAAALPGQPLVVCHATTPLIPAATIERCAEAVLGGATAALTAAQDAALVVAPGGWNMVTAAVPVLGVVAFAPGAVFERFPALLAPPGKLAIAHVTRKQALSLADDGDLEIVQALEFAGCI